MDRNTWITARKTRTDGLKAELAFIFNCIHQ
jgi:hypothetical protein